jgi:hypothetical protein
VLQPTAGIVDLRDYRRLIPQILVEERHAPGLDR